MGPQQIIVNELCKIRDGIRELQGYMGASESRVVDVYFVTVPETGGTRTFSAGTTKIDFKTGTIINPDASIDNLTRRLDLTQEKEVMHSISMQSDKDIKFRLDSSGQHSVGASFLFQLPYVTYTTIEIECEEASEISIFACTNPQATLGNLNIITDIRKSERLYILESDKDTHFTGSIAQYAHEEENIDGLSDPRIFIRGVNIQSDQPLKYRLIFWMKDTFADTDLDVDSYVDDVILDMSDDDNAFRINNTGQYYLNVSNLNILYEDEDSTTELHCSLQNLSPTSKNAGASGEVQLDFKYAPRL